MTEHEYRHALHLLDTALALFENPHPPATLRRDVATLALQFDLLRAGLLQAPATTARN